MQGVKKTFCLWYLSGLDYEWVAGTQWTRTISHLEGPDCVFFGGGYLHHPLPILSYISEMALPIEHKGGR